MRLANKITLDNKETFGVLKFSALRREVFEENEDGTVSDIITGRTYDLKCKMQGCMIQVTLPADVPLKEYPRNAVVELVNPVADTVASVNFPNVDVVWYLKSDDFILKEKPQGKPQPKQQENKG